MPCLLVGWPLDLCFWWCTSYLNFRGLLIAWIAWAVGFSCFVVCRILVCRILGDFPGVFDFSISGV